MTMQRRRETKKLCFRGNLALKVLIGNAHVRGVIHAFAVLDNQQLRRGVLYLKSLCDCLRYVTVPNQVYEKNINRLHFFRLPGPFEAAQGHAADATTSAVFIDNGGALMRTVFDLIYRNYGYRGFSHSILIIPNVTFFLVVPWLTSFFLQMLGLVFGFKNVRQPHPASAVAALSAHTIFGLYPPGNPHLGWRSLSLPRLIRILPLYWCTISDCFL